MSSGRRRNQPSSASRKSRAKKETAKRNEVEETQVVEIVEDPLPEEISLEIPDVLQQLLEKDCINIVHLNYSLKLPRNPNVCDILLQYYSHVGSKNGGKGDHSHLSPLREILDGLKTYFDVYLPVLLLYDEEKGQYKRECQDVEPSQIYGFEHLLRLFVKVPYLLSKAKVPHKQVQFLHTHFKGILQFLKENASQFTNCNVYIERMLI